MIRLSFPTHWIYLGTTMYLLLIKVLSNDHGYGLSSMYHLSVLFFVTLIALHTPTVGWYQSVRR